MMGNEQSTKFESTECKQLIIECNNSAVSGCAHSPHFCVECEHVSISPGHSQRISSFAVIIHTIIKWQASRSGMC